MAYCKIYYFYECETIYNVAEQAELRGSVDKSGVAVEVERSAGKYYPTDCGKPWCVHLTYSQRLDTFFLVLQAVICTWLSE